MFQFPPQQHQQAVNPIIFSCSAIGMAAAPPTTYAPLIFNSCFFQQRDQKTDNLSRQKQQKQWKKDRRVSLTDVTGGGVYNEILSQLEAPCTPPLKENFDQENCIFQTLLLCEILLFRCLQWDLISAQSTLG